MTNKFKMNKTKLDVAKKTLTQKYEEVQENRTDDPLTISKYSQFIEDIFLGTHLTYKYILFTALLGKASFGDDIDPLYLQAGAGEEGGYDARSLCHKVVVPFEREYLKNILGGSNEPFLNKPARYLKLSKENAVRAGKDKEKLDSLVDNLSDMDEEQASIWLTETLNLLLDQIDLKNKNNKPEIVLNSNLITLKEVFLDVTEKNFGGEMLALSVGALLSLLFTNNYNVVVHKVNQSGSSSKETGDIDVFLENELMYALEAKSKPFALHDVEHAVNQAKSEGLESAFFIYNHTDLQESTKNEAVENANNQDMLLSILHFNDFCDLMLSFLDGNRAQELPKILTDLSNDMHLSKEGYDYMSSILDKYNIK